MRCLRYRKCATVLCAATVFAAPASSQAARELSSDTAIPVTGVENAALAPYDTFIVTLMKKYHMPGAAVAVARNGRLVYARGFGWSNVEDKTRVAPDALFRIASVSKPITSAAVLTLVQDGRLSLDEKIWKYIDDLPSGAITLDPRWKDITVRQLLNHSGGWDRERSFDIMFRSFEAAHAFRQKGPASPELIIRYMKGKRLDFKPGTRHAYSNFGYVILGHIIERVTKMSYVDYTTKAVLRPAGIRRMQQGHTRLTERLDGEVNYYFPNKPLMYPMVNSVYTGEHDVPQAYGGFYLEAMAAHGAWVSSTIDLLRFVNVVDGHPGIPDILTTSSLQEMLSHDMKAYPALDTWYGLGWGVRPSNGDFNYWHDGSLPGTVSLMVRAFNGMSWVALFNAGDSGNFMRDLDSGMWTAMSKVTTWPDVDLFSRYP